MAEYIDREELLTHQYNASHGNWPQLAEMVVGVEDIEDAPAADVEEVVRCKDCYQSVVIGDVLHCTYWSKDTDENGYCHEGG